MSTKFIRLMLAIAMLFSTVGMGSASMLCSQKQRMSTSRSVSKASACPKCHSTKPMKNGCCKTVYSHLGMKTEYQRPAPLGMDRAAAMVLAILVEPVMQLGSSELLQASASTGPPIALSSPERCSRISSFRI